jgi:hypothetical protein
MKGTKMPKLELNFLPEQGEIPTDEQLFLELVYGLCGSLNNPKEEHVSCFFSSVGIPYPHVRRLAKLLVEKLNLPIPTERVDEWIEWRRKNGCWIVSEQMDQAAARLSSLTG